MTHHCKVFDLEITDFENHRDPTTSCEIMPSQTLYLKHVENKNFQINQHMIHH